MFQGKPSTSKESDQLIDFHCYTHQNCYLAGRFRLSDGIQNGVQFNRIIQSAGLIPWPRLFNNLRSTRRTELQEAFPSHVIDSWLGHSTKVAEKHYLQVTDDHWKAANSIGSPTGSPIKGESGPISNNHPNEKTPENMGEDASGGFLMLPLMTPTGFEPVLPA
jgi:hypothetical protein